MKKLLPALLVLLFSASLAQATDTLLLRSKIKQVTLFFTGAQITRSGEVNLRPGEQFVMIKGLSQFLRAGSVQVSGLDEVQLLSLQTITLESFKPADTAAQERLETKQKAIGRQIADLKHELSVYEQEEKILLANSQIEQNRNAAVQTLREAADFYRQRLMELRKTRARIARDIEALQEELKLVYQAMSRAAAVAEPVRHALLLSLRAPKAHKINLVVSYFDEAAGWAPNYEFRVKQIGAPAELSYMAEVYQFGGENWEQVSLKLSTANPLLTSEKPELLPWVLGQTQPATPEKTPLHNTRRLSHFQGKVTDEQRPKEGIPFANVVIKQNGKVVAGTTTDIDGRYKTAKLPVGLYDIQVSYVGYNPSLITNVSMVAERASIVDVRLKAGTSLSEVVIVDYEVPLISKDETRRGGVVTREEIAALPTRDVNSISGVAGGVFGTQQDYLVDGIRVGGSSSSLGSGSFIQLNSLLQDVLAANDELPEYLIEGKQSLPSDGEKRQLFVRKAEVSAEYVYHLVPRVSRDAFLVARIPQFQQLGLLAGEASVYYQGTFIGRTPIQPQQLSDTLLLGLGRDPSVQAVRVQDADRLSKRILGSNKQEINSTLAIRSSKEVAVKVVVEDQVPISEYEEVSVEVTTLPKADLDARRGLLTWQFNLPAQGSLSLSEKVVIRSK
ncbi:MAG: hypothetical protein C0424_01250 [Sphingobacteriaceae bacterium]|nr:hypothetical protein [Sphingobacteriaceae bacterium]